MKYILTLLLLSFTHASLNAQEHYLYADVGYALSGPGLSVTYNYRPVKHIGMGIGAMGYEYKPSLLEHKIFAPAVFGEFRINIRPERRGQLFTFLDIGMNFYKHSSLLYSDSKGIYQAKSDNGFYAGLGTGYFRRLNERGWGLYLSVKAITNTFSAYTYYLPHPDQHIITGTFGALAFSLGFMF